MTQRRRVVFDLDGTLVESSNDIARALNAALGARGGRPLTGEQVNPLLGHGVHSLVESAVALAGLPAGADLTAIRRDYLAEYHAHPVVDSTLYAGIPEALEAIASADVAMGVCTNKPDAIARQVLSVLGVSEYLPVVVGADRVEQPKPHPDHLISTLTELGGDTLSSFFVGDSIVDQQCGQAAGVDFLAVPWAAPQVTDGRLHSITDLPAIVTGQHTTDGAGSS